MFKQPLAILGLSLLACSADAQTRWDIVPLGIFDAYYGGSYAQALNQRGQVMGYTARYSGFTNLGKSAWIYDGNNTIRLGYFDSSYTRSDGYQSTFAAAMNNQGQVIGSSDYFQGATSTFPTGRTAWLYDNGVITKLGLFDSDHTRSFDGAQFSAASMLNEQGHVVGASGRFVGSTSAGSTQWIFDGTDTVRIGLFDSIHTRSDGYQSGAAQFLNAQGHVAGYNDRFNGTTDMGESAWLYNGSSTVRIGFTGSDFTRSDGYQNSVVIALNDQGQAAGYSISFKGTSSSWGGGGVWLYDGSTHLELGFTDSAHTRSDGYQFSTVASLNNQGQAIGTSFRYSGTSSVGTTAWFYDGANTVQLGLTDTAHTVASTGGQVSSVVALNEAGQIIGGSTRYSGSSYNGGSAWFYDGQTTTEIGLTGGFYTNPNDGSEDNRAEFLNERGQVAGYTRRYIYGSSGSAWLYDSDLDQTFDLTLSERSDGRAFSRIEYLGDDGVALGYYTLYDTDDSVIGDHAFYFSVEEGLFDLGDLALLGGLDITSESWMLLASAIGANVNGDIIGQGLPAGGYIDQAFLLKASAVPVPAAAWLFGSALLGLVGIRRKVC